MDAWGRRSLARCLLALVGVAAVLLGAAGCSAADGDRLIRPIDTLFAAEQQIYDRLPPGAPALLTVVPGSSRYLGLVGVQHFYVARGVLDPYCVVVTDVYGAQVFQRCGGDLFGGDLPDGVHFEFGAFWAKSAEGARGSYGLGEHLNVALGVASPRDFPAIVVLLDRAQVADDVAPSFRDDHGFYVLESMRLVAVDGENRYYFVLSTWPGMEICLIEERGDSASGSCGWADVVLRASFDSITHFSAAGFDGEVPEGWRQLSDLVRVGVLEFDEEWSLYPTGG